jgi:GxxExxY protein
VGLSTLCRRHETDINELASKIIEAAITVPNTLGPGLLESVYQSCMVIELQHLGLNI